MSEKMYDPYTGDEISIDDLISQAKEQSESAPGMAISQPEQPAPEPVAPVNAAPEDPADDFMPDFGDAFADYGVYDEPVVHLPQMGSYEVGGYEEQEYYEEQDYAPQEDYDPLEDAPAPQKPRRKHRRRLIPLFVKVLLYLVLVVVAAVGLGYGAWECAQDVLAFGRSDDKLTVTIQQGDTVEDIALMLSLSRLLTLWRMMAQMLRQSAR